MLTVVLLMASCMKSKDNESGTLYNDTAITAFSLGTLNRYLHTISSTGEDSIYKVTVTGSDYKFSIDQENHRIFNADSLPGGTDVKHVVCSVASLNNGTVFYKSLVSDTIYYHSSTDSIDFSSPRQFLVFASNGNDHEEYTIEVNVHQEEGEQFIWMRHADNADIAALEKMKAVTIDGTATDLDFAIYNANNGNGRGWKHMTIENVAVSNHKLLIGTMTGTEESQTEKVFGGAWYSVGSWTLKLVAKGDNNGWVGPLENGIRQAVVTTAPADGIYTISGVKTSGLQRGLNIIVTDGKARKVFVK